MSFYEPLLEVRKTFIVPLIDIHRRIDNGLYTHQEILRVAAAIARRLHIAARNQKLLAQKVHPIWYLLDFIPVIFNVDAISFIWKWL